MGLRVRIDISDQLTYGDLYQFVNFARTSGVTPDTKVVQVPVREQEPDLGIDCYELELPSSVNFEPGVTLPPDEARSLASLLETVVEEEGDARKVLAELREWRDRLIRLDSP